MNTRLAICLTWISLTLALGAAETFSASQLEFFEKRIRPALSEHCLKCHGKDAEKIKGGLWLTSRESVLKGGDSGPALVPGKPAESRLVEALHYKNLDLQMPPREKLPESLIADFETWIQKGAAWPETKLASEEGRKKGFDLEKRRQEHWVWRPIGQPKAPSVKNEAWIQQPMDRFILSGLEKADMQPAPRADKRTLIRRASFDLRGLPPSTEEVDVFLNDDSPGAFARVVDEFLKSPQFGERWARHWMDLVRYAESMGHEFDFDIHNAWMYRDYLIRAFNSDVPYNQLIREHIAGDLIQDPRKNPVTGENESLIGTASYWLPQQKHSPVDIRQEQSDLIENQIDVVTKAFMGITVACARCHDHKFDAITTEDFYSLYGILSSSRFHLGSITPVESISRPAAKIRKLNASLGKGYTQLWKSEAADFEKYLQAVIEVRGGTPDDILFEDFEKPLTNWTMDGDFNAETLSQGDIGSYQGNLRALGARFLNTHNLKTNGKTRHGDGFVGRFLSPSFEIEKRYIHMLVGGGSHVGKTCINILIDGQVIQSLTGSNNNQMAPATVDLGEHRGKTAQIEVVDQVRGGWGNIGLDHIVFSDASRYFTDQNQPHPSASVIHQVAEKHDLSRERLEAWITALSSPPQVEVEKETSPEAPCSQEGAPPSTKDLLFSASESDRFFLSGEATRDEPTQTPTAFRIGDKLQIADKGWLHTGLTHPRLEGTLRTPTFQITKPYLHLHLAGQDSRASLMIENFTLIRNPIYGGLKKNITRMDEHWVTMDLSMWIGRNAWLEFADNTGRDPAGGSYKGSGFIALKEIIASDEGKAPARKNRRLFNIGDYSEEARERVATILGAYVDDWSADSGNASPQTIQVLNWLLDKGLLSSNPDASTAPELASTLKEIRRIAREIPTPVRIASMTEGTGIDEPIFIRGGHRNPGRIAPRGFLEALTGIEKETFHRDMASTRTEATPVSSKGGPRSLVTGSSLKGSGRSQLAASIVHPSNPLTPRVAANRVWHHLMGRGIVASTDDFGVLGERPTHPELLDHLATRFMDGGWSIKSLIREILLSSTYQMSSTSLNDAQEEKDPTNSLWHRAQIRRLQGEAIRDAILMLSGKLDSTMYGPSVPVHLTPFMQGRGRPGTSGPLDGGGRRSVYLAVRRNFLSPFMQAFDAPVPSTTIGRRTVSNVPAQALILMNDPFVAEQAAIWAEDLLKEDSSTSDRISKLYESALGRPPTKTEAAKFQDYLKNNPELGEKDKWTALCHVVINLKEFIFIR